MTRRRLCWRLWRGRCCLDLVEETTDGVPPRFIGLLDGVLASASGNRREAAVALVRRVAGDDSPPTRQTA